MADEVRRLQLEIVMDETGAIVGAKNVSKANKKLEKSTKKTAKEMTGFTKIIKSSWLGIAGVIIGAAALIKKAFDFSKAFLEYRQGMDALARNTGQNADKIVQKLSEVTKGTVDNKNIMLAANRLVALNVTKDTDKMAKLFEIARLKAKAMGISTTQAISDISTGIGRNSPLILDNLGIITKGWAEEAKAAGQAMDAQFILNKILRQGAEELDRTGARALTGAERLQRLNAATSNLKVAFGKFATDGLGPVVKWLTKTITTLGNMMTAFASAQQQMAVGKKSLKDFGVETSKQVRAVEELAGAYEKWKNAQRTIEEFRKTRDALAKQGRDFREEINQDTVSGRRFRNMWHLANETLKESGQEMNRLKKVLEDTNITTGKEAVEALGKFNEALKENQKLQAESELGPPPEKIEESKVSVADYYTFINEQRELDLLKEQEAFLRAQEGLALHIEAKKLSEDEARLAREALEAQHQINLTAIENKELKKRKKEKEKRQKAEMKMRKAEFVATKTALGDIATLTSSSNKKLFAIGKAASVGKAIINVLESVTKTMASTPFPLNLPLAALQAAAGAVQISKIRSQTMAEGGVTAGPSHAQGGINVNAEGGEFFVRKASVTPQTLPILSAINKGVSNLAALSIPANSPVHGMQGGGIVNNSQDDSRRVNINRVEITSPNPEELFTQFIEFGEDMGVDVIKRG